MEIRVDGSSSMGAEPNTQPPGETDLGQLLDEAKSLEPDIVRHQAFLGELNGYCPGKPDSGEKRRGLGLPERTSGFIDEIVAKYDLDGDENLNDA